ncbi:ribose 5-phosphate isomerase B [Massiliimalia massiliensis]|jgi:ribose 5-phosphate isomerase B|uniref:ribose 5-phosphate isomerase B n=1 Tax=Massiliimalia massiliensis TaxID=1852384 RepID=UPI0009868683|nr:ribose 5-phosphate isomerase B [Massiliimalia massiliensis]
MNRSPIIIGCDHGGYLMKQEILKHLEKLGIEYTDIGCNSEQIVRYPIYASNVARRVSSGEFQRGILICSTGIGMSIVANRFPGVRASVVADHYTAEMTRQHNDSNILCLGGKVLGCFAAIDILDGWLESEYIGGRHDISLAMISQLDRDLETHLTEVVG